MCPLSRNDLPKGIISVSKEYISSIAFKRYNIPTKSLNFWTPIEYFRGKKLTYIYTTTEQIFVYLCYKNKVADTIIFQLTAGQFRRVFKTGLKITSREGLLFTMGELFMGFVTRLAKGCNVGKFFYLNYKLLTISLGIP